MIPTARRLIPAFKVPIRCYSSPAQNGNDLPHMNFRNFVEQLRQDGDLAEINTEIDPDLEVGAIIRKQYEKPDKASLFNNIKGTTSKGLMRMLGAPAGLRPNPAESHGRVARHLGLPSTATIKDIQDEVLSAKNTRQILAPKLVKTGPCKENILLGDQVDLLSLPAPKLHTSDGGKYLQTYGLNIIETPDKSWTSWSIARGHVYGKNKFIGPFIDGQHITKVSGMWKEQGKDCPWALALGAPPAAVIAGSMPLPDGVSEPEYVGAMTGIPVEVVKCETNNLYVPANSEIVLEGRISPLEVGQEGPMGEMHGYVWLGDSHKFSVFTVDAITFRNNPILPVSVAGRCVDETHTLLGGMLAAEARDICAKNNLPVKNVHAPYETNAIWLVLQIDLPKLRAMNTSPDDFCKLVGDIFFMNSRVANPIHNILLVGDDIDIFNFSDVIWAYATRCRPRMQTHFYENCYGFALCPFMSHGPGPATSGGKVVSDCIFPGQYKKELLFETCNFEKGYSKDLQDKINNKWNDMGFVSKP